LRLGAGGSGFPELGMRNLLASASGIQTSVKTCNPPECKTTCPAVVIYVLCCALQGYLSPPFDEAAIDGKSQPPLSRRI